MTLAGVYASIPGGVGVGSGEPLARRAAAPGGVGVGSGEPLALSAVIPGGVGVGRGDPLRAATEASGLRLPDNCLTELLMGSTIEKPKTSNARRIEMFFFMGESLLIATMKKNSNY
jgi:hypothetical protein